MPKSTNPLPKRAPAAAQVLAQVLAQLPAQLPAKLPAQMPQPTLPPAPLSIVPTAPAATKPLQAVQAQRKQAPPVKAATKKPSAQPAQQAAPALPSKPAAKKTAKPAAMPPAIAAANPAAAKPPAKAAAKTAVKPAAKPAAQPSPRRAAAPSPRNPITPAAAAAAPAARPAAPQAAAQPNPAQPNPAALKPLLALGVAEGLFLIAAASAALEPVQAFARYQAEPLPRLITEPGYFNAQRTNAGPVVYTAFMPWPGVPAGALQLGCITASGRKPLFSVDSLAFGALQPDGLAALRKRFGSALLPVVQTVLPAGHALRLALQPPPVKPATAQCHFEGVVDGRVQGWAYDSAQPGKALTVEVLYAGQVVARGLADLYRQDLRAKGMGDGRHHYRLRLSYELFDGQPHALSVRVVPAGPQATGPESPAATNGSQPTHLDWIPRAQTLGLAAQLGRSAAVRDTKAEQALLQAFARCCLQQETWLLDNARAGYQRLAEILAPNALCHCKMAETWLLERQLPPAAAAYREALALDPQFAWAHLGLGNVLRLQGQPQQALAAYRAALACAPGLQPAQQRLVAVQDEALAQQAAQRVQAGDKAGAIALLRAAVFDQPDRDAACDSLDALLREPSHPAPGEQTSHHPSLTGAAEQAERARRLLDAMLDEADHRLESQQGLATAAR